MVTQNRDSTASTADVAINIPLAKNERFYGQMAENIRAWLDGKPVRVMTA